MKAIIFTIFLILALPHPSWAMSICRESENFIQEYPVIFKGRVVSVDDNLEIKEAHDGLIDMLEERRDRELDGDEGKSAYIWTTMFMGDPKVTTFKVIETYKGELPAEVKMYHSSGMLRGKPRRGGVSYTVGETYIVLSDVYDHDRYMPSLCGTYYKPNEKHRHLKSILDLNLQLDVLNAKIKSAPKNITLIREKVKFLEEVNDFLRLEGVYAAALETFKTEQGISDFKAGLQGIIEQKKAYDTKQKKRKNIYVIPDRYNEGYFNEAKRSFDHFLGEIDQ